MEPIYRGSISFLFAVCFASGAFAQDGQPDQTAPNAETAMPANGSPLTGKERLGTPDVSSEDAQATQAYLPIGPSCC